MQVFTVFIYEESLFGALKIRAQNCDRNGLTKEKFLKRFNRQPAIEMA